MREHLRPYMVLGNVAKAELYVGDSHSDEAIYWANARAPFDFIFFDGDHSYEGVKNDTELARKIVRNGVLVWHDYRDFDDRFEGVCRYIDECNSVDNRITLVGGTTTCFEVVRDGTSELRWNYMDA